MCKCTPGIRTPFCGKPGCEWPAQKKPADACDPVVEAVRKDLLDRSNVGIEKYGTTLAGNNGDLRYWLQHAYEECLDQANYLKRAIMEIYSKETCTTCKGSGQICTGSSGREDGGNGPITEPCPECGYDN